MRDEVSGDALKVDDALDLLFTNRLFAEHRMDDDIGCSFIQGFRALPEIIPESLAVSIKRVIDTVFLVEENPYLLLQLKRPVCF